MNVPVTGPVLIEKAAEIAPLLKVNFITTPSWVEKFKQRRGIVFRVISQNQKTNGNKNLNVIPNRLLFIKKAKGNIS